MTVRCVALRATLVTLRPSRASTCTFVARLPNWVELLSVLLGSLTFCLQLVWVVEQIQDKLGLGANLSSFVYSVLGEGESCALLKTLVSFHLNFSNTIGIAVFDDEFNDRQCLIDSLPLKGRRLQLQQQVINDFVTMLARCQVSNLEQFLVGNCPLVIGGHLDQ